MAVIDENDVGKTREEVLLDLLYEASGQRIPLDKIKFGKPCELDKRKDLATDANTFIPAQVDRGFDSRYSVQSSGFMYRRRDLGEDVGVDDLSNIKPTNLPFKVTDVLELINRSMRYPLQPEDVVNYEYTTLAEVLAGVKLHAHPESLLWIDGLVFQVDVGYLNGQPLVQTTALDGFKEFTPI